MEESLSMLDLIRQTFPSKEVDIRTYSPLTLAYVGDSVYDLIIRTAVVDRGNRAANGLHKSVVQYVNAAAQAALVDAVMGELTEEEVTIYKRGRNAKSYTSAKNASIADYRKATGLEALVGYLYLTERMPRVMEILKQGMEACDLSL